MSTVSIYHLFPSDQIDRLPTWRFIMHFKAPPGFNHETLSKTSSALAETFFKIITFPFGVDSLEYDETNQTILIPIEVPEAQRRKPDSLKIYEGDIWKLMAIMYTLGYGDLYYQAVDWEPEE